MRPALDIEIIIDNIFFDLEELLNHSRGKESLIRDGETIHEICLLYRKLGIAFLLCYSDVESFIDSLSKSVGAYLCYLEQAEIERPDEMYYACTSRAYAFFDALAIKDTVSVKALISRCKHSWQPGNEEEEDYCYYKILMLIVGDESEDVIKTLLGQYQSCVSDSGVERFGIVQSLLQRDAVGFESELHALIVRRQEEIKSMLESGLPEDPEFIDTEAFIFIEGMALVSIAQNRQMKVPSNFLFVPDISKSIDIYDFRNVKSWYQLKA